MKSRRDAAAALVLVMATSAAWAVPRVPDRSFECQVLAKTGVQGLVSVQADTLAEARRVAKGAVVVDMSTQTGPVLSIIECVERPEGTFSDAAFRDYVEQLDR